MHSPSKVTHVVPDWPASMFMYSFRDGFISVIAHPTIYAVSIAHSMAAGLPSSQRIPCICTWRQSAFNISMLMLNVTSFKRERSEHFDVLRSRHTE